MRSSVKRIDELLERELLALVGHRPAHERQVVDERLGQVPGAPVEVQAHRVLALRDLRAVGVAQERQVAEHRRLPAEPLVEPHVLRQRRQPLLGAYHVADPHQVVVDHVRQVIGGEAVALQQDLVVHLGVVEAELSAQQVAHHALAVARHRQADDARLAGRRASVGLGRRERPAQPVVAEVLLLRLLLLPERVEPLPRAEAAIRRPAPQQLVRVLAVDGAALALTVGSVRPAAVGALVPLQAEPAERLEDHRLAGARAALAVGVLDAQHELPAVLSGERVVEERDVGGAHVRVSRRARGNARSDRHGQTPRLSQGRNRPCPPA